MIRYTSKSKKSNQLIFYHNLKNLLEILDRILGISQKSFRYGSIYSKSLKSDIRSEKWYF